MPHPHTNKPETDPETETPCHSHINVACPVQTLTQRVIELEAENAQLRYDKHTLEQHLANTANQYRLPEAIVSYIPTEASTNSIDPASCCECIDQILAAEMTARKQAEEALYQSELRFRTLIETVDVAVLIQQNNRFCYANVTAEIITGYSRDTLVGMGLATLLHPDSPMALRDNTNTIPIGNQIPARYDLKIITGSNQERWIHLSLVGIMLEGQIALLLTASDITQRKQSEAAISRTYDDMERLNRKLTRSRNLLRAIFDHMNDGVLLLDGNGVVLEVNCALARLLHTTPNAMVDHVWATLYPQLDPAFPGDIAEHTRTGAQNQWRRRYPKSDGKTHILDFQTIALYDIDSGVEQIILRVVDVTEILRMQALFIENERFAASGRLAASVAHEINTPLQAIQNSLKLVQIGNQEERDTFLTYARQEIRRVGDIVHQLLDLYRPGATIVGTVQINVLIERILLLIGKRIRDQKIVVEWDLASDLPSIQGRSDELMQVFLNLIVNALDAMPDGGRLRIHASHLTHKTDLSPESNETARIYASGHAAAAVQQCIPRLIVELTDTGCGILGEGMEHIFDPFVTTKEDGVGLGLAITAQIIQQHGGTISVISTPGTGSCFCVTLPLLNNTDIQEQKPARMQALK